ncbi:MAG: hypothetical protein DMD48_05490 [Gemmatimonadetes bacterium]|nr:MAG: hypothetical protein DMD48_05490 [Gemmatimonadota bacterium]PYU93188.1 MAG: hypothetical protein DMG25_10070 [Acidobacteriota bacterium]PYV24870.1 MAG: hypothetical protein DMG27_11835 [Acidobacteriota bacterium]
MKMNASRQNDQLASQPAEPEAQPVGKRPYQKPAFRCEQVFETMALSCGKISPTQAQCKFNKKNS